MNHSSEISSKDFIKIYKKYTAEQYSFLVNDATLASDNYLRFRNFFSIYNKIMTINDQVRDEKLLYDINRKPAEISVLSSGKIDNYEYLTVKEILPSNQQQIIELATFTYSPLGKLLVKQVKTVENQGERQIKAIQNQGEINTSKKYLYTCIFMIIKILR